MTTVTTRYEGLTTAAVVEAMLRENTGQHFLDSGGAYGRNWERNQTRDFAHQPVCTYSFSAYSFDGKPARLDIDASISLFHWMVSFLEFDPELSEELAVWQDEHPHDNWLQCGEEWAHSLFEEGRLPKAPQVFNTYNYDNIDLTQVIQYIPLYLDPDNDYDPTHVAISVHGGCDVRGGYTAYKVFKCDQEYGVIGALDQARVDAIYCDYASWYDDAGYFRSTELANTHDGYSPDKAPQNLLDLDIFILDAIENESLQHLRQAITNADQRSKDLAGTTLNPDQLASARQQIAEIKSQLQAELVSAAADHIADTEGWGILVHERRAYLVDTDLPDNVTFTELHLGESF